MINEYLKEMEYQIRTKFNRYDHYLHKLPILKNKPLFQFKRLKSISIALSPIYNLFQSFTSTLASLTFLELCFIFSTFLFLRAYPIALTWYKYMDLNQECFILFF